MELEEGSSWTAEMWIFVHLIWQIISLSKTRQAITGELILGMTLCLQYLETLLRITQLHMALMCRHTQFQWLLSTLLQEIRQED
ncbi:unnamed protein product [Blepharisma stoltei]|uniref:Uncharacterized protein n=1 Tax=Blepharisma stoltei TaxID=1481888 RepID=A0AAU9I387_9CILI|nr:unnamed protein product [Blepharisma stoltei]